MTATCFITVYRADYFLDRSPFYVERLIPMGKLVTKR